MDKPNNVISFKPLPPKELEPIPLHISKVGYFSIKPDGTPVLTGYEFSGEGADKPDMEIAAECLYLVYKLTALKIEALIEALYTCED